MASYNGPQSQLKSPGFRLQSLSRRKVEPYFPIIFLIVISYHLLRHLIIIGAATGQPTPTISDKVLAVVLVPFAFQALLNFKRLTILLAVTFGGYGLISVAGALAHPNLGIPQPLGAIYDLVREATFPVFFLAFLYFWSKDRDPLKTLQLIAWFYVLFAVGNAPFILKDLIGGGSGIFGQELGTRLGFVTPQGLFQHKVESSWAFSLGAACAVYLYSLRPTFLRMVLILVLSIFVFIHLSAKECAAFLVAGIAYQFRGASSASAGVLARRVVPAVVVVCMVLLSPISNIFLVQYNDYVAQDGLVRTELTKVGFEVADRFFPLGSGGGTFASPASFQLGYSQLYVDYGISTLWSATPDNPAFLLDVFWPKIIAQGGWLGFVLFLCSLWTVFSRSFVLFYLDKSAAGWLCFSISVSSLIFSTAIPSYTSEFLEIPCALFAAYAFNVCEHAIALHHERTQMACKFKPKL